MNPLAKLESLHKEAAAICARLITEQGEINVASKMLNHCTKDEDHNHYQQKGDAHFAKSLALSKEYQGLKKEIDGYPLDTARSLNREETKEAVSEMTNMELAEQHANQN